MCLMHACYQEETIPKSMQQPKLLQVPPTVGPRTLHENTHRMYH